MNRFDSVSQTWDEFQITFSASLNGWGGRESYACEKTFTQCALGA
jgi:hypothetical protein